jgi:PPP family 3-phenylpropionic acid transporter
MVAVLMLNKRGFTGVRIILLFWFSYMGLSAINPFFSLYLKKIIVLPDGRPMDLLIGILLFCQSFLFLFSAPAAGYLADRFKIENRVLLFCTVFVIAGAVFLGIPGFSALTGMQLEGKIFFLAVGAVLTGLFLNPVYPLISTEALEYLHKRSLPATMFGRYRINGTLSWVVNTALVGMFLWLFHNIAVVMVYFCLGFILLAVVAFSGIKGRISRIKIPWDHLKRDKAFKRLLVFCFLHSFGFFGSFSFTAYFFDDYHLGFLFIGLAFAVSSLLELPVMFFSKNIAQKIGSYRMVLFGAVLMVLKNLLLAFITPLGITGLVLAVNLLHGAGFGLWYLGIINLIDAWAHKHMRAIYLNLFTLAGSKLPIAAGVLLSALVIHVFNSTWMMFVNIGISFTAIFYLVARVRRDAVSVQTGILK